jgi:carboxymethylenebutenolidase
MDAIGYREQLKENARRFAADGYWCAVPDLFHHFGESVTIDFGKLMEEKFQGPEIERMFTYVRRLKPELVRADTEAVLAEAAADPAAADGPKVCVGYCMGARFSLHTLATMPEDVIAGAGIHPGPLVHNGPDSPHRELDTVSGELYFAFASNDEHASPELVERLRTEMEARGVPGTVETMPGTFHGFAMADLPPYKPEAAERHFEQTLMLWRRNLDQRGGAG